MKKGKNFQETYNGRGKPNPYWGMEKTSCEFAVEHRLKG